MEKRGGEGGKKMEYQFSWDEDDVFDESFFLEVDKLEELALTQHHHHHHHHPPPPPTTTATTTLTTAPHPPTNSSASVATFNDNAVNDISYSPPRQLSQRFNSISSTDVLRSVPSPVSQDRIEIDRLKCELNRVSKQLSDLKEECSELKRERSKKQPKHLDSNSEACMVNPGALALDFPRSRNGYNCANAVADRVASCIDTKSIGIQTERGDEPVSLSTNNATSNTSHLKLQAIWSIGSSHRSRRYFIAKLLETCATDFCFVFGLSPSMISKTDGELLRLASAAGNMQGLHSSEAARVSHLYSVLMKLSNDMAPINALVEALLDLCGLGNALVVRRSLHILHVALDHLSSMDRDTPGRDNVKVERLESDAANIHDLEVGRCGMKRDNSGHETSSSNHVTFKNLGTTEHDHHSRIFHVRWFDLFESVRQIAERLTEENVRSQAVSIMNLILMRTNAYSDRRKFGSSLIFKTVALLLRKGAGLPVQKEAVHLVFLLLNSPDIFSAFCKSCKIAEENDQSFDDDGAESLTYEECCGILEGLADCVVCQGCGEKELNLRRSAIMVLAFLASSGKSGLEIFLFHKMSERANFLGLILQVLVSETDADALDSWSVPAITKTRTQLIREALILLNRLASHPAYSSTVFQVLMSCRDLVSLAIDVATRLSKRSRKLLGCDSITRQMRETEVVDLAQVFRRRVFCFVGENVTS